MQIGPLLVRRRFCFLELFEATQDSKAADSAVLTDNHIQREQTVVAIRHRDGLRRAVISSRAAITFSHTLKTCGTSGVSCAETIAVARTEAKQEKKERISYSPCEVILVNVWKLGGLLFHWERDSTGGLVGVGQRHRH